MTRLLVTSRELKSNDTRIVQGGKILALLIADTNAISGGIFIIAFMF